MENVIKMSLRYTNPASHSKCKGFFLRNVFIKYIIGSNLAGMRLSEEFLETQDHLDFTTIHPAHLLNGPVTGKSFLITRSKCANKLQL